MKSKEGRLLTVGKPSRLARGAAPAVERGKAGRLTYCRTSRPGLLRGAPAVETGKAGRLTYF